MMQHANMTSFKLKSAQGLAIWRIQYHKNLITDKNVPRKRTAADKLQPGGVLPYITYIVMCRCEGYGFQAVWSGIGYRNQGVLV